MSLRLIRAAAARLPLAALITATSLLVMGVPAQARPQRHCPGFRAEGTQFALSTRGHVSCAGARSLMRAFLAGKGRAHRGATNADSYTALRGWRCGGGAGGVACSRDRLRDYVLASAR